MTRRCCPNPPEECMTAQTAGKLSDSPRHSAHWGSHHRHLLMRAAHLSPCLSPSSVVKCRWALFCEWNSSRKLSKWEVGGRLCFILFSLALSSNRLILHVHGVGSSSWISTGGRRRKKWQWQSAGLGKGRFRGRRGRGRGREGRKGGATVMVSCTACTGCPQR